MKASVLVQGRAIRTYPIDVRSNTQVVILLVMDLYISNLLVICGSGVTPRFGVSVKSAAFARRLVGARSTDANLTNGAKA